MDWVSKLIVYAVIFTVFAVFFSCYKQSLKGTGYGGANTPPYPVTDSSMPQPSTTYPSAQIYIPSIQNYSPANPYPPSTGDGYPNPMPYPPMSSPAQSQSELPPPSYAEAVNVRPMGEVHTKQAPYNPNF